MTSTHLSRCNPEEDAPLTGYFLPAPSGQAEQTLILLHGWGANAQDLMPIVPSLNLPNLQAFCPNATFSYPAMPGGRMWYVLGPQLEFDLDPDGIANSGRAIAALVEHLAQTTGIPSTQTVIAGFSQGGAMALDVGSRLPIAGLVSMSGYLHAPLDPQTVCPKPALVLHGSLDPVVSIAAGRQAQQQLTDLGFAVTFAEFAIAHGICDAEIDQLRSFLTGLATNAESA